VTAGVPSLFINRSHIGKEIADSPSMPLSLHRSSCVRAILRPIDYDSQTCLSGENFLLPFAYIFIVFWDTLARLEKPAEHPFAFAWWAGPSLDAFCHRHFQWVQYLPLLQVCSDVRFLMSYMAALAEEIHDDL